jgi:hypothetical protein
VGAVLLLALASVLPAVAQGATERLPAHPGFELSAGNGYSLFVLAGPGPEGEEEEGTIGLFLLRATRMEVARAYYTAPATVTRWTIDADLGALGSVSVSRVLTGRTRMVRRGCKPRTRRRVAEERYEGTIEFHGEEGFADVSATAAPSAYVSICVDGEGGGTAPRRRNRRRVRLDVEKRRVRRNGVRYELEFDAVKNWAGGRTALSAELDEQRGEMSIERTIATLASSRAMRYDRRLRAAAVRPPAPFAGHARFRRTSRYSGRWTGNLTVDLPGQSDVPVTGPGFSATLEHPRR